MFFAMKYTCRKLLYSISITLNNDVETRDVAHNATLFYKNPGISHIHVVHSFGYYSFAIRAWRSNLNK